MKKKRKSKPKTQKKHKKKGKKRAKKRASMPMPMMVKSPPLIGATDVPTELEIICPGCRTHWANAHIKFGEAISKDHFAVREDLKASVRFHKKSGLPYCPLCGFEYTPKAIYGLMMAAATRARMERDTWATGRFQKPPLPEERKPQSFGGV